MRGFIVTYTDVDHLKRIEIESGMREHRLRLVADNAGSAIFYLDRALKIRFANQPFAEATNRGIDEMVGTAIKDVVPPDAWTGLQPHLERVFAGAKVTYERQEQMPSGEQRWIRVSLLPDRHGGRVVGAFAVLTDIQGDMQVREAMRSQETQLRLFTDNIPGPIAYLDRALEITFVQSGVRELGGRAQDEIYGRTPHDVMPRDVSAFLRPILSRALAGEQRRIRTCRHRAVGRAALDARTRRARPRRRPARCAGSIAPSTTSTT